MVNPVNNVTPSTGATRSADSPGSVTRKNAGAAERSDAQAAQESVVLSAKAGLAHQIAAAAQQSPGVDGERVQAIRASLANNQYTVSPQAIAKAVVRAAWLVRGE